MSNTAVRLLLKVTLGTVLCGALVRGACADEADDQFALASNHYASKHWDASAEAFHKFLHDHPDHANRCKAMFYEAESLVQLGRSAEAYPLFLDVLAEEPTGATARVALFGAAEAAVFNGQADEAQIRLLQFQSQFPGDSLNAKVSIYLGDLAMKAGDLSRAEQLYRESMQKYADQPITDQCRLNLIRIFEQQKQFEAAENMRHEVAQRGHSPWAETALLQLASQELVENRPQSALEQYKAIEEHFPSTPLLPQTHLGCGRALYQLAHYAEAEDVLGALTKNPAVEDDAQHWLALCQEADKQAKLAAEKRQQEAEVAAKQAEQKAKVATELRKAEAQKTQAVAKAKSDADADRAAKNNQSPVVAAPINPIQSTLKSILSSRRDPKAVPAPAPSSVAANTKENGDHPATKEPSAKEGSSANTTVDPFAATNPAASTDSTAAAAITTKPAGLQPVSPEVAAAQEEQTRRRSAVVRYQAAESMIRAHQYDRAIATLQIGDNSGDDPHSLANRYLLYTALQADKRSDEAQVTLDDLSEKLQVKLAASNSSSSSAQTTPLFPDDLTALRTLNDQVQMARATLLLSHEKYAEAIVPLQTYLDTPRKDVGAEKARYALTVSLTHVPGRLADAQKALEELKANHPSSAFIIPATEQVADAAYAANQYSLAATAFKDLAADGNPSDMVAKGLSGAAWCHLQMNEEEAADQAFAKFLERCPSDSRAPMAALARGQILERENHVQAALVVYREAIKRYGQSQQMPKYLHAAARLYDRVNQQQDAASLYQRLARDYPTYPEIDAVLYSWAWSLRDLGHAAESDKVFRLLYDNQPHSHYWADATYRLAERASQQGDNDTASAFLKQVVESSCPTPVLQHALFLQSQLAIAGEKWADAEPALTRIVRDFPDGSMHLAAEFWLAEIAYRAGDYTLAQQRFEELAPRAANGTEKWAAIVPLRRAQIFGQQKQWGAALELAASISHDYPQFSQQYEADYLIGRCLAEQADFDGARAAFDKVIHSSVGGKTELGAIAQWMTGETYYHQGNYSAALHEYLRTEVVYSYPHWQAAALLQAAKCYEQLGQAQQASEMYSRVLQSYPQTEFVAEASKRLVDTTRR